MGFMETVLISTSGRKIGDVGCISGKWDETQCFFVKGR